MRGKIWAIVIASYALFSIMHGKSIYSIPSPVEIHPFICKHTPRTNSHPPTHLTPSPLAPHNAQHNNRPPPSFHPSSIPQPFLVENPSTSTGPQLLNLTVPPSSSLSPKRKNAQKGETHPRSCSRNDFIFGCLISSTASGCAKATYIHTHIHKYTQTVSRPTFGVLCSSILIDR